MTSTRWATHRPTKSADHIAAATARLTAAGLRDDVAARIATHPYDEPLIIGPGIVVSLFADPTPRARRSAAVDLEGIS